MKILITGSEGFLGKNLANFLSNQGFEIIKTDLNSIENQPIYNPLTTLVYSSSRSDVSYVWIDGEIKFKDKKLVKIDEERIIQLAKKWQRKLKKT